MFVSKLNQVLSSKTNWKTFISDRLIFYSLVVSTLVNIIQWLSIYIKIKPGSSNILLHYNVIYGSDLVDQGLYAYMIPGIALLFLILNIGICYYMYQREKLASYFLSIANLPVQVVFLVAAWVLVVANS